MKVQFFDWKIESLYWRQGGISGDLVMLMLRQWLLQVRARICLFSACPGPSVQGYCKISVRTVYTIYYGVQKCLLSIIYINIYYVYVHINMYKYVKMFLGKK